MGRYQGWSPMGIVEARAFLEAQSVQAWGAVGEWLQVAVALRDDDALIGDIGLCLRSLSPGVVEIGYSLAAQHWVRGLASEALTGLLDVLFGALQIDSVVAVTDSRNLGSVALLQRLHFDLESTEPGTFRGEPCIDQTFRMAASGWAVRGSRKSSVDVE